MKDDSTVDPAQVLAMLGLDFEQYKTIIENVKEIETDEEFFKGLSAVAIAKKILADAAEVVENYATQAKGLINARAKALYGPDWTVIKGEHFKIGRQFSGNKYEIIDEDKVPPEMVKVKIEPNSEGIDAYRESNDSKLPEGVAVNEHRGESIRITIK